MTPTDSPSDADTQTDPPQASLGIDMPADKATTAQGYQVLARKYRPQRFEDLIGQDPMVRTLSNAFDAGRVAHAFMLTGVRGVGKTTTARLLARALNYKSETVDAPCITLDPPGEHCAAIAASRHVDVLEMDAASHTGVSDIRDILEGVRYAPVSARYKIYIIDEVHMLSKGAFNALLKTLEEPPPHAKFIFATTEIRKVPVTVLSRCQRFDLARIGRDALIAHLHGVCEKEGACIVDAGLALIARAAEGSVRDALSILDQALVQSGTGTESAEDIRAMLGLADRSRVLELFALTIRGEAAKTIDELRAQYEAGADPLIVLRDILDHCHQLTRYKALADDAVLADYGEDAAILKALAKEQSLGQLSRVWQLLLKALDEARRAPDVLAAVEMALVRLCVAITLPGPEEAAALLGAAGSPPPNTSSSAKSTDAPTDTQRANPAPKGRGVHNASAAPSGLHAVAVEAHHAPLSPAPPSPASGAKPRPSVALESLAAVADFLVQNRELTLAADVRRYVHLVSYRQGSIVFAPGSGAPPDLATRLSKTLGKLTNMAWLCSVEAGAPGAPSLAAQQAGLRAQTRNALDQHPDVLAVKKTFPGAKIIKVRKKPSQNGDL